MDVVSYPSTQPTDCIVLANGRFPEKESSLALLRQAQCIVCCDGAVNKLVEHDILPTVIVGDGDSMTPENKARFAHLIHADTSEDYNDLQKALKYCLKYQHHTLTLLGCDGLREDHFIANLSIMGTYSQWLDMTMITHYGTFYSIRKTTTLPSVPGQQVSIFCKDEMLDLTFHGLKYPVKERSFRYLWEASLNEALRSFFTIELHRQGTVIVYLADMQ